MSNYEFFVTEVSAYSTLGGVFVALIIGGFQLYILYWQSQQQKIQTKIALMQHRITAYNNFRELINNCLNNRFDQTDYTSLQLAMNELRYLFTQELAIIEILEKIKLQIIYTRNELRKPYKDLDGSKRKSDDQLKGELYYFVNNEIENFDLIYGKCMEVGKI